MTLRVAARCLSFPGERLKNRISVAMAATCLRRNILNAMQAFCSGLQPLSCQQTMSFGIFRKGMLQTSIPCMIMNGLLAFIGPNSASVKSTAHCGLALWVNHVLAKRVKQACLCHHLLTSHKCKSQTVPNHGHTMRRFHSQFQIFAEVNMICVVQLHPANCHKTFTRLSPSTPKADE